MPKTVAGTHRTPAQGSTGRSALRLLRRPRPTRAAGPPATAAYDEFGQSLHLFACALTDDAELAGQLVIQTILAHQSAPRTLQDLSAGVYIAWIAWGNPPLSAETSVAPGASATTRMLHEIHGLPADQRAALGLCKYGDHTYRQAAAVLGLAPDRTAQLLCDALRTLGTPRVLYVQPSPAA